MTVGEIPVPYAPRSLTTLPPEQVGGWMVKRYAVSALREAPVGPVHEFARLGVERSLPPSHVDSPSGAYSVVHEDEDGCYVVVGWWSRNGLILHTRTWLADWEDLDRPTEAPGHATACVWELVAMAREREAWVRYVLVPDQPDLAAYLADTVSGRF